MKGHRPWQPHLDRDPLFNPFVPTTVRPFGEGHVELEPEEEVEQGEEQTSQQLTPDQAEEAKKE